MNKVWRIVLYVFLILLLLGIALVGVGLLTDGDLHRILQYTEFANLTKFFTREQLEAIVGVFYR